MNTNKRNQITAFYSPQGGGGKSTIAINTAIISAMAGKKTLLVDMSIFGSVISSLKIQQRGGLGLTSIITLLDLKEDSNYLPDFEEVAKNSIIKDVCVENLDVLISANPIKMEAINKEYMQKILEIVGNLDYDNIFIDTSSELNEKNFVLLKMADSVVMPVVQDVSCGWKLLLFKEISEKYIIDSSKISLIVNKCTKYSGFNNLEFEKEIGYKIIGEIPLFIKKYQNYINEGVTINLIKNKKAYKNYYKIAKEIITNIS